MIESAGRVILSFFESLGSFFVLFFQTVQWLFRKPFDRKNIINQMIATGINSLPIALITAFFTGMVMSLQTALAIERKIKGASTFIGSIVGLAMVRELGPVLAAVFIAGRVGSAIAAEIGSMKVTDQIDALYSLSTSPIQYLVVPRFLALIIMIPLITVFTDLVGILGGGAISFFRLAVPLKTYVYALQKAVHFGDIMSGVIKSGFFGAIIALVGCQQGLKTWGGAEGVGEAVTKSVVIASIAILISDYFLTLFLNYLIGI